LYYYSLSEIDHILDEWSDNVEQEIYSLPPHRKCACHLLNLIASVDCETALKRDAYSSLNRSTFAKLQTLFNKQSRSTLASEKTK
jgi:hypothetical protein